MFRYLSKTDRCSVSQQLCNENRFERWELAIRRMIEPQSFETDWNQFWYRDNKNEIFRIGIGEFLEKFEDIFYIHWAGYGK